MVIKKTVSTLKKNIDASLRSRREALIEDVTINALKSFGSDKPVSHYDVVRRVYNDVYQAILNDPVVHKKSGVLNYLNSWQYAQIALYYDDFRRISFVNEVNGCKYDVLALYVESGSDAGTYTLLDNDFRKYLRTFNDMLTTRKVSNCLSIIKDSAPYVELCNDPDLIAVNNGIFNYKTKELMPFSKDKAFLSKVRVDYVSDPVNPVIHSSDKTKSWDIESWMSSISGDADTVDALWKIAGACIRPNVLWDRSVWLYSEDYSDNEYLFYELLMNLACGIGVNISATNMDKQHFVKYLIERGTIIADSDSLTTSLDAVKNLKPLAEGEAIQIVVSPKCSISYVHKGIVVEYMSEVPPVKKKRNPFLKNQIYMYFKKGEMTHKEGDFYSECVERKDVLEYVLHKVLHMDDYYALPYPHSCKLSAFEHALPVEFD